MTIYEIKRLTNVTAPYFFSKDTMRFFGQTLRSFKVKKQKDGRFKISAPSNSAPAYALYGDCETVRYFNPDNNELELKWTKNSLNILLQQILTIF